MRFKTKDKARILLDNSYTVKVVVTTAQSKYRGKTYNLNDADWRARVDVDISRSRQQHPYAYYYWGAIKLSDTSERKFVNFTKINRCQYDCIGKEISNNSLLFCDGNFYKVEFCTANFVYLSDYDNKKSRHFSYTGVLEEFNSRVKEHQFWKLSKENTYRFLLIDNPLDLLRIVDENR